MTSKAEKRRRHKQVNQQRFQEGNGTLPSPIAVVKAMKILEESVLKLDLPYDTVGYPLWRRFKTVGELVKQNEDTLFKIGGIGPARIRLVKAVLAEYGLRLAA